MDGAVVRPASLADQADVFALVNQLHPSLAVDESRFTEAFPRILLAEGHCCVVLELEGVVAGYASGYKHLALYAAQPVAYLDEIIVGEDVRGTGGGTRLLTAFEQWAEAEGCALVGLATRGARGFYEKLGYQSRAGYYKKALTMPVHNKSVEPSG